MKILLTGAAGYIGSHTAKYLAGLGFNPIVYDNLSRGNRDAVKWGILEQGDILDRHHLEHVLRYHRPAAVIHFAGLAYVGESVQDPAPYFEANVIGALNLLDAMRATGIQNLVFSSSCTTFLPSPFPIQESAERGTCSPYGLSKLMMERVLETYDGAYGFKSIALRYFNAAGADPEGEIGEMHAPETHLIPLAIKTAMGRRPVLKVNGTDHPTIDGTCIRDYVHVWDLAQAHYLAMKRLMDGGDSDTFNLGSGLGYSVKNVIHHVAEKAGYAFPVEYGPARPGDAPSLVANPSHAIETLGWNPEFSDLPTIIETAWNWHTRNP